MSFNIDKTLYPELFSYSVLAQTGITTPVTSDPTTINYGYYGNAGGLGQITGTYEGSAVINNLSTTISSANSQLATVVGLINSNSFTVPYSGGPNTFGPGILFTTGVESLPAGNITPSGTLTFDGGFIATSQLNANSPLPRTPFKTATPDCTSIQAVLLLKFNALIVLEAAPIIPILLMTTCAFVVAYMSKVIIIKLAYFFILTTCVIEKFNGIARFYII